MTRRRFIADTWAETTAALTGDQAYHLAHVLRAEPGQIYDVVANGFLHRAEIASVSPTEVRFTLYEELEAASALPLHLLLAVFKFDSMEWAIEKATELGVERITPVLARRTEKHLALASAKRVDRWRRIALEASKQSRRTDIPEIADPQPLKLALEQEQSTTRILLSETEQTQTLTAALNAIPPGATPHTNPGTNLQKDDPSHRDAMNSRTNLRMNNPSHLDASNSGTNLRMDNPSHLDASNPGTNLRVPHPSQSDRDGWDENPTQATIALAIGPEGGWTPEEMALFATHHWQPVTVGPRILRAETAAIAAIAIVGAHLVKPINQ